MHIAFFTPLNPVQSGISDYSEELLPWLAQWADIDVFVDGYRPSNRVPDGVRVQDVSRFSGRASRYDAVIYQMGNSPAHAYIYRTLLRYPGIVVLHEHVLHHLIAWMSWDRGDARTYLHEFRYCYGAEGEALARRIILGQAKVSFFDYPLSNRVINAASALIVHSELVRQAVLRVRPDATVHVSPMGIPLPPAADEHRIAARQRLGLPSDALVIGSFGHMNPFKRLHVVLRAFRRLLSVYPKARYVLVGSMSPHYDLRRDILALGLEAAVIVAGYTDTHTFQDYLAATDICVNLRHPTAGETSASVLRLMGAGLPVLVSATGTFLELPDGTCVKVDTDESEEDLVFEYLRLLAHDISLRCRIGTNARRYIAEHHTMEMAMRGYLDALSAWQPGRVPATPVRPLVLPQASAPASAPPVADTGIASRVRRRGADEEAMLDLVAQAAAELGLGEDKRDLEDVGRAWAELSRT